MAWRHKKESKWLVVGKRKVRCYLCGRKILRTDSRIYDPETGHYSHASCETERSTIDGNDRRKAVKRLAMGAGIAGLVAVGADKFHGFVSQSEKTDAQFQTAMETIITSQGIILPSLTSDPANPAPGQMWYRSDAGVIAHFDAIQNRVVYSSEINDGNVNVTSKGIVNGLSVLPNDGTGGFGPDTKLGATSPSQYGPPYTHSTGIREAWNYAFSVAKTFSQYSSFYWMPIIQLMEGYFEITEQVILSPDKPIANPKMVGKGSMSTYVGWNFDDAAILVDHTNPNFVFVNMEIGYMQPVAMSGTGTNSTFFSAPYVSGDPAYQTNTFQSYDIDISNSFSGPAGLYLTGFGQVICYNLQAYAGGQYGALYCDNVGFVAVYGGSSVVGGYISNTPYAYLDFGNTMNTLSINNVRTLIIPKFHIYNGINIYGNTGIIQIINCGAYQTSGVGHAALLNLASGASSATVDAVIVDYFNGQYAQTYKLVNGDITVNNVRVHNVELVAGASLGGDWENVPSTPSVPPSGTAQLNTNPYAVDVYVYGGDVTEIQITKNGKAYTVLSNLTGLALSGQSYKLNPQDRITLTYSAAPTWEWLSD